MKKQTKLNTALRVPKHICQCIICMRLMTYPSLVKKFEDEKYLNKDDNKQHDLFERGFDDGIDRCIQIIKVSPSTDSDQ